MRALTSAFLIAMTTLCACASTPPPVGRIEARGDLYAERGSPELARAEYLSALEDQPDNARLREKLATTQQALREARVLEIEQAIGRGEPIVAAYALSKARREFGRDDEQVLEMESKVVVGLQSALRVAEDNAQFDRAFELHAALLAYVPERSRANRQEQRRYRDAWVKQLRARALEDESQRLRASAALHWQKIASLTKDEAHGDRARAQRELALAPHVYSVSMIHNEQAELDQRVVLPHLEEALTHPDIALLADGSAAQGATFTIKLRDLECDERQEMRAPNKVASKKPVIIQRCVTTFGVALMPVDAYREELFAEQVLVEEVAHQSTTLDEATRARTITQITDRLHAQGAVLIADLLAQDLRSARDRIVEQARTLPLERAELDAHIIQFWLEPAHYGTRDLLDAVEAKSGFDDAGELLRREY